MMNRTAKAARDFKGILSRQAGYTVGELLITIGVVSILSTVAVPGMQTVVENNRRVSVTNDLVYTMRMARSESVSRNQRVTVCASADATTCGTAANWSTGWIMFNDINNDGAPGGTNESILFSAQGKNNVTITPTNFQGSFTYRPNGRVMGNTVATTTGEFTVCDGRGASQARVLVVASSGRPRISETTSGGAAPTC